MQFTTLLATLSAAVAVQAQGGPIVTPITNSTSAYALPVPTTASVYTTVVDSFTTVCATPTTITYNNVCYTASTAYQTLTITNCPCTITSTYAVAQPTQYVQAGGNKVAGGVVGALAAGAAALIL